MRKRRPVVMTSLALVALLNASGVVLASLKGFRAWNGGANGIDFDFAMVHEKEEDDESERIRQELC